MKKFDERFMQTLSADSLRHYSEEYLLNKIYEDKNELEILTIILRSAFECAINSGGVSIEIPGKISDYIKGYLKTKGLKLTYSYTDRYVISWDK